MCKGHVDTMKNNEEQEILKEKLVGRERKIGQVLGCVAYYLLKRGRPNCDFTTIVSILAAAGVDMGDINHSEKFAARRGPVCASVIKSRLQQYLRTPLPQTGHKPPVKGVADKAT